MQVAKNSSDWKVNRSSIDIDSEERPDDSLLKGLAVNRDKVGRKYGRSSAFLDNFVKSRVHLEEKHRGNIDYQTQQASSNVGLMLPDSLWVRVAYHDCTADYDEDNSNFLNS